MKPSDEKRKRRVKEMQQDDEKRLEYYKRHKPRKLLG